MVAYIATCGYMFVEGSVVYFGAIYSYN